MEIKMKTDHKTLLANTQSISVKQAHTIQRPRPSMTKLPGPQLKVKQVTKC